MEPVATPGEDRIATIPNAITVMRLCLLPVFLVLIFTDRPRHWYAAAWVLAAMGCTDWVDGYLARRLKQVSTVGKILDPVADRLLLICGAGSIVWVGAVPVWVAAVALGREVIVAVTVVALAAMGSKRIDVTWWGKAGAFGLMVAFPLFLCGHSTAWWHHQAEVMAWIAFVPGMIFGLYSLILYVPLARDALADGRRARLEVTP